MKDWIYQQSFSYDGVNYITWIKEIGRRSGIQDGSEPLYVHEFDHKTIPASEEEVKEAIENATIYYKEHE